MLSVVEENRKARYFRFPVMRAHEHYRSGWHVRDEGRYGYVVCGMIVGLRHDLDTVYGLRWGLPKIVSIEKKCDVRSTFFVRVDVVRSDKDRRVLKRIADEGWEIGLHLINTVNDSRLLSPEGELKLLRKLLGVPIYGVTPCGSTIGQG